MPECVYIKSRFGRLDAEFIFKILESVSDLSDETLARRHIAIGLKIPAAYYAPLSSLHEFLYFFKKFRIVFLGILVNRYFVMTKNIIVFIRKFYCAAESR